MVIPYSAVKRMAYHCFESDMARIAAQAQNEQSHLACSAFTLRIKAINTPHVKGDIPELVERVDFRNGVGYFRFEWDAILLHI